MPRFVSECFSKQNLFYKLSNVVLNFVIYILYENLQFNQKMFPLHFQSSPKCIHMPIILSEFSFRKILQYYELSYVVFKLFTLRLDENLQYYHKLSTLIFSIIF